MARKPAGSSIESPPYLSLDDSLKVAQQIQERGGGTLSLESLAEVFGNSLKSSSFERKLSALKNFGLVERQRDAVRLTKLALAYVAPTAVEEQVRAKAEAMRNVPLLRTLHDRFAGGVLPPADSLANLMLREYGANEPLHRAWADFFAASLRSADLLSSLGGRTTVRRSPDGAEAGAATAAPPILDEVPRRDVQAADRGVSQESATVSRAAASGDSQRLEVRLHDGSAAAVFLPRTADPDDIADVIALLEIMKKRAERVRPPERAEE
jgi:hypothetical protein